MGSKGHVPPHHLHPLSGSSMLQADPFGRGVHPQPGPFPFDMLPPPEILEQRLAAQHMEMRKIAMENERFAVSHSSLRKELATTQHELQRLQEHAQAVKAAREQQMRVLVDQIVKMENDLKASEPVKVELQQAHTEAKRLVEVRQELVAQVRKLTQDLQKNQGDLQQMPALVAELEAARKEYENFRDQFHYERTLRLEHGDSIDVLKKNCEAMVREVEKLRAELAKATNFDRSGSLHSSSTAQKEIDASARHSIGRHAYENAYGVAQARAPSGVAAPVSVSGSPARPAPSWSGYDASRGTLYDSSAAAGAQAVAAAGNSVAQHGSTRTPPPPYAMASTPSRYGAAQMPPSYGSGPAPSSYGFAPATSFGSAPAPPLYGSAPVPPSYGLPQAPPPHASAQGHFSYGFTPQPMAYGSAQTQTHAGGPYDAPHGNVIRR